MSILKQNTKSHSHKTSNNTDRIISLFQDQIEFLQEHLKLKDKIINSPMKNLSRNDDVFFSQKAAILKASENETNYEQLKNTKTIDSKEIQSKTLQDASTIKRKKVRRINKKKIHLRRSTRTR